MTKKQKRTLTRILAAAALFAAVAAANALLPLPSATRQQVRSFPFWSRHNW